MKTSLSVLSERHKDFEIFEDRRNIGPYAVSTYLYIHQHIDVAREPSKGSITLAFIDVARELSKGSITRRDAAPC